MLTELDTSLFTILDSEVDKTLSEWCFIEYNWKIEKIVSEYDWYYTTPTFFANADSDYIDKYCKIYWHYPTTNTILRYIDNFNWWVEYIQQWFLKISKAWYNEEQYEYFDLDITKEIKDYTDEQKQELINFLKSL